jgi:hypothetical protein
MQGPASASYRRARAAMTLRFTPNEQESLKTALSSTVIDTCNLKGLNPSSCCPYGYVVRVLRKSRFPTHHGDVDNIIIRLCSRLACGSGR